MYKYVHACHFCKQNLLVWSTGRGKGNQHSCILNPTLLTLNSPTLPRCINIIIHVCPHSNKTTTCIYTCSVEFYSTV